MDNQGKRSFAQEGLDGVNEELEQAEATVEANAFTEPDEWQEVSEFDPLDFFYRFNPPKPGKPAPKQPYQILSPGTVIKGTYERSFTAGKHNNPTHIVLTAEGKRVGIPGATRFNTRMAKVTEGTPIKITYGGMKTIAKGAHKGTDAHEFLVQTPKVQKAE